MMTLRGDAVRHTMTEDGRPAPELYEIPFLVDIVMWVPCMYVGEILGSATMACFMIWTMHSTVDIIGSSNDGQCQEELSFDTYFLTSLILIKAILAIIVALRLFIQSYRQREARFQINRVVLRRQVFFCRTTTSKNVYAILFICDLLTVSSFFICMPIRPIASEWCHGFYQIFLLMLYIYQALVVVRLPVMLCMFMFGKRFWRWIKRLSCCKCLNTVEYEQTVNFRVYQASDYVEKVNADFALNQSSCKSALSFEELTCAICLEDFQKRENAKEPTDHVVALGCNESHTFHPGCLRLWLKRSPDCPLCKMNVFTREIETQ